MDNGVNKLQSIEFSAKDQRPNRQNQSRPGNPVLPNAPGRKVKKEIQILIAAIALLNWGCSPKINKEISFDPKYDNKVKIEKGIEKLGVQLTLLGGFNSGKGLLMIKDSNRNNIEETTFTLVQHEVLENGIMELTSSIPTNEGVFRIRIRIKGDKQESDFSIVENWQKKIEFETKFSSVRMSKPIHSNGTINVELAYKGQQIGGKRTIELKNEFFFNEL